LQINQLVGQGKSERAKNRLGKKKNIHSFDSFKEKSFFLFQLAKLLSLLLLLSHISSIFAWFLLRLDRIR
jgi:hypothetical protein